jgi:N utilization substance protein B
VKDGPRHQARQAALQMLYQWEIGRVSPEEAVARHWEIEQEGPELSAAGRQFAEDLAEGTITHLQSIDTRIEAQAQHWRLERMAVIDRLILRMAVYEFTYRPDTPRTVVINEAIELARTFSEQDAVRFVNGVLDGIHHTMAARGTTDA